MKLAALGIVVCMACTKSGAESKEAPTPAAPHARAEVSDAAAPAPAATAVSSSTMTHIPAPPPIQSPVGDTTRFVAWLTKQGKPTDGAREDVSLRIGDWGFFDTGPIPGRPMNRVALDKADHAVQTGEQGDWFALLGQPGLDAAGAHERIAWLFRAQEVTPERASSIRDGHAVTAPKLTTNHDGSITFEGWLAYPPAVRIARRLTIVASPTGTKIVSEPSNQP